MKFVVLVIYEPGISSKLQISYTKNGISFSSHIFHFKISLPSWTIEKKNYGKLTVLLGVINPQN